MTNAVWLLDVDGVINANKPGWGGPPRRATACSEGTGFVPRWAPALLDRIRTLDRTGMVDIRWSTTWCTDTDELHRLFRIGPFQPAFRDRPANKTWAELKVEAALQILDDGRRLIWTDDAEVDVARRLYPQLAEAEAEACGRALLIAPKPNRGLQPEHMDQIEAFAETDSATPPTI